MKNRNQKTWCAIVQVFVFSSKEAEKAEDILKIGSVNVEI